jgi:short-subunit dehydrogenase
MNRVSYISGATGFVGLKLTEHLAGQGKNLLLSARDGNQLKEITGAISKSYPQQNFQWFTCDLTSPESWESAVGKLKNFTVDQYINCSGFQGQLGLGLDISFQDMKSVFNVNLFSSIFFTNYFSKSLRMGDKLSIIHFSGGGSTSSRPQFMSYSLSKTSLLRFVENFAQENLNANIKINAIAPGVMPSKMQEEIIGNLNLRDSKDYAVAFKSLSNKNFDWTNLISLCDFLLTEKSDGISGKLISAEWDNWTEWPNHLEELKNSDLYTLSRIVGRDRGQEWGDL